MKKYLIVYKWVKPQKAKWWEKLLGKMILKKIGKIEYEDIKSKGHK